MHCMEKLTQLIPLLLDIYVLFFLFLFGITSNVGILPVLNTHEHISVSQYS